MPSGKSSSPINPDGIRRIVNGKNLAKRSLRKSERVVSSEFRWSKVNDVWTKSMVNIEMFVSKVFEQ